MKVIDEDTVEMVNEVDAIEYLAFRPNGKLIAVSTNPEEAGKKICEMGLTKNIDGIAYQSEVNTCPQCGMLYDVEELIQLEDDIICSECNEEE